MRNGNDFEILLIGYAIGINCTLRNGNRYRGYGLIVQYGVLIVPCGMETRMAAYFVTEHVVLIVPCGMETGITAGLNGIQKVY